MLPLARKELSIQQISLIKRSDQGLKYLPFKLFILQPLLGRRSQLRRFSYSPHKMGLDVRKPVFGVSEKERLKPVSSATETS